MTGMHFVRVLIVRRKLLAIGLISGLVIALVYITVTKPIYLARAEVVLNIRAPETVGTQSIADQLSPDYLLTQEDILKSARVAMQVARATGLANSMAFARAAGWTPADGAVADHVAKMLQNGLRIGSSAVNSRVISIGYASGDPQFSAKMANAFAEAYADVTIDLQAEPARRTVRSYTNQLAGLSAQLAAAQTKLAAQQKALGIVSTRDDAGNESVRLDALSSQLAAAQAQQATLGTRPAGGTMPEAMGSPVIQALQSEIARLEGQRRQLATTAGPNNPDYLQLQNQIAELRQQAARQEALVRESVSVSSRLAGSTVSNLQQTVAGQRQRVIAARAALTEVSVLEQDVANLKSLYDQVAARRAQLKVLDEVGQTNISVLTRAMPSRRPVWPRRLPTLLFGLIGGVFAAALLAIGLEFGDRRLRKSEEFETWLGIPDLGSISLSQEGQRLLPKRIAGLLPHFGA